MARGAIRKAVAAGPELNLRACGFSHCFSAYPVDRTEEETYTRDKAKLAKYRRQIAMRAVNIADLKNNLSRYLNEVRRGGEVVVKDRNNPIARIVPLAANEDDDAAELMELVVAGSARLPRSDDPLPKSFWSEPLPKASVDLIDLLREDRDAR